MKYIRISINAGSNTVQKLTTGVDDFDLVLHNVEKLIEYKEKIKSSTDISIGYVVNVLNLNDLEKLSGILLRMEEQMQAAYGIKQSIFSLQIRPVSNYENSKHIDQKALNAAGAYLKDHYGASFEEEYYDFMLSGAQCSKRTLKAALDTIENVLIPKFSLKSNIRIVYPRQKYIDLIGKGERGYDRCLSCPWFLFIWPDGNVYHCVEWAGTPGFEIGNLNESRLEDILMSQKRKDVLERINTSVIKERCAPVCAHHEMNLFLNTIKNVGAENISEHMNKPEHLSFL
jgi:radical SAM protein with 4Fe4S-binding SPASM domain